MLVPLSSELDPEGTDTIMDALFCNKPTFMGPSEVTLR